MPSQKIDVHLKVPMHPLRVREDLEAAGFEVGELFEVRGGVFNAVDLVGFVVEYLDETVISLLASVVGNWLFRAKKSGAQTPDEARFSAKDAEQQVIVQVTGDGNWVQVHPRPEVPDEEE